MKHVFKICILTFCLLGITKPLLANDFHSDVVVYQSDDQHKDLLKNLYFKFLKIFKNSSAPGSIVLLNTINQIVVFNNDQDKYIKNMIKATTDPETKAFLKILLDKPVVIYRNNNKAYVTTYMINTNDPILFDNIVSLINDFYSIIKINKPIAEYPDLVVDKDKHEIQIELSPNNTKTLNDVLTSLKDNKNLSFISIKN